MRTLHLLIPTLLLFVLVNSGFTPITKSIPQGIVQAINKGNANDLAKFFSENVELVIFDDEAICSKSQAEQILRVFFSSSNPNKFEVVHQGESKNGADEFVIGKLYSLSGNYRVSFWMRSTAKKVTIQHFRIEVVS